MEITLAGGSSVGFQIGVFSNSTWRENSSVAFNTSCLHTSTVNS